LRQEQRIWEKRQKEWSFYPQDVLKSAELAGQLAVPAPIAQILLNRGVSSAEEGEEFLHPDLSQLHSPFALKDMEAAVEAIVQALKGRKKIAVYGDYDADGITATALLVSLLRDLGGEVVHYIPNRLAEGYSLRKPALLSLKNEGVALVITVDCGVASQAEILYAQQIGMEVIVTDHHQPQGDLPSAVAVINPLRTDCSYPFKKLCGVGIAYKLGTALLSRYAPEREKIIEEYLDLVAIGTVADVSPLLGENRIFVYAGLQKMHENIRPGIKALCLEAGLKDERISARQIAFILAPHINAPGRIDDALPSLKLLLEENFDAAESIARDLHKANLGRQGIEAEILAEACKLVEEACTGRESLLLLASEGWHPGVLGIVASRMTEKYSLPVILLALEEGIGKGSGRSYGRFDITAAVQECAPLLLEYGGHRQACGLTVKEEHILLLREQLSAIAEEFFRGEDVLPKIQVELVLEPEMITPELLGFIETLAPFGQGNPQPVFAGIDWTLAGVREVGQGGRHLQMGLQSKTSYFRGISFNGKENLPPVQLNNSVSVLFSIAHDNWRGENNLQLIVQALTYGHEHRENNLILVDRRHVKDKKDFLRQLLGSEEQMLVFVNTAWRMQELKKSFSKEKGIAFSHQGRLPQHEPGSASEHGQAAGFRSLVLYDPPLSGEKLADLCRLLQENMGARDSLRVYLLYGADDFSEILKLLRATAPSYSSLELIYYHLQEVMSGKGMPRVDLLARLKKALPIPVTGPLLEKSLDIYQEAGYLALEDGLVISRRVAAAEEIATTVDSAEADDDYCLFIKELSLTAVYSKEREKWENVLGWLQYFLFTEGEQIASYLTKK